MTLAWLTKTKEYFIFMLIYFVCLSACQTATICDYKENQSPDQSTEIQWAEK